MNKKSRKEYDFFNLYDKFLSAMRRGKHKRSKKYLRDQTLKNYFYLRKLLVKFCEQENFSLHVCSFGKRNSREMDSEKFYWEKFYDKFIDFLYDKEGCFDNYVGVSIKMLRAFFKYLNDKLEMNTGNFYKDFLSPHEEIQIVTLTPERLKFLIYNKEFENSLSPTLKRVKDLFVFGCRSSLRISDLLNLKPSNMEMIGSRIYLRVTSKKTGTFTRIKLPEWAVEILYKYNGKKKSILPIYHKNILGKYIKQLAEKAGWTEQFEKIRHRREQPVIIYKDEAKKTHYRFCDLVSTHTMRRTGVTYMLSLGMNQEAVRKISGHAHGSKEFFRYVSFAQSYLDKEADMMEKKFDELESSLV